MAGRRATVLTAVREQQRLNHDWDDLMSLCERELALKRSGAHPKLLKFITLEVDRRALELGFSERQVRSREFRAVREDGQIAKLLLD